MGALKGNTNGFKKGQKSLLKGKTYEEVYGRKKAKKIITQMRKNHKGMKGKHHSMATIKKMKVAQLGEKNYQYGTHRSKKWKKKMSLRMSNEKHPAWKGDKAGYISMYKWLRKIKIKSDVCEFCGKKKKLQLSNIIPNHICTRNPEDYRWLCCSCHRKFDYANGRYKACQKKLV